MSSMLGLAVACGPDSEVDVEESTEQSAHDDALDVAAELGGNLIRNGNFERHSDSAITDWTSSCGQPVRLTADSRFDRRAAELVDASASRGCALTSASSPVQGGGRYTLDAWLKWTSGAATTSPRVYFLWLDEGGVELSRPSIGVSGAQGTWVRVTRVVTAPVGARWVKVMVNSSIASVQTIQVDAVTLIRARSLAGSVERYVAPVARGMRDGLSAQSPAAIRDATFWASVQRQLATTPVRVVVEAGRYEVASADDMVVLARLGHPVNRLVITGADASSVRFVSTGRATATVPAFLRVEASENITFANLHFRTEASFITGYLFLAKGSKNLSLENVSSVDTVPVAYGVLGFHEGSRGITVAGSEFVRLGFDAHQHFLYDYRNVDDVTLTRSVFEDCPGAYVRCRDRCGRFTVKDSVFRATGTWGTKDELRYPHFVELALFNDRLYRTSADATQQEFFAGSLTVTGNVFQYQAPLGRAWPVSIHHSGYRPFDGVAFRDHLFTASDAAVLSTGTTAAKRALIAQKFRLDLARDFVIRDNVTTGARGLFEVESRAAYGAQDAYPREAWAGSGAYDVSSLFER